MTDTEEPNFLYELYKEETDETEELPEVEFDDGAK